MCFILLQHWAGSVEFALAAHIGSSQSFVSDTSYFKNIVARRFTVVCNVE